MTRACALLAFLPASLLAANYDRILIAGDAHPAIRSAARILARNLGLPETAVETAAAPAKPAPREIVLEANPGATAKLLRHDGYVIAFQNGGALIQGARPRSLLYAAADAHLWRDRRSGTLVRDPSFAVRVTGSRGGGPIAEHVAALGVNVLTGGRSGLTSLRQTLPEVYNLLSPEDQQRLDREARVNADEGARFIEECRDADVTCYVSLPYGNNFSRWSPALYAAVLKAYPTAKGVNAPASWEKAALCPSDPGTWKVLDAYVKELARETQADGLLATFWDQFGMYCQCDRCRRNGLNKFPNELYVIVKHYHDVLEPMGKKLMLRTWSSGAPHWLRDEWVHAPGYDAFGGSATDLWSRVIKELPADIVLQTKVYHSDCEPDARMSTLIGTVAPHTEVVEYQVQGQFTGRFYFPASMVDYMVSTMKKSLELIGPDAGVEIGPGGTMQSNYSVFDDILNSINVYAWRELSWNVNADVNEVWSDWALPIYGEKAAPHMTRALKLSEEVARKTFSPLGFGSSTNSDFAGNIARRETLLRYTNRYYLPDYAKFLEPTKDNITRVAQEKAECRAAIDEMFRELEQARPNLTKEQAAELSTRFDWLREFSLVNTTLDESLWRFRYLRAQAAMLTTDPEQMKYLAQAYDIVTEHQKRLFQFNPALKFSCYNTTLGQLRTHPALGNPVPLMKELYDKSKAFVEESTGPDYLPPEWRR